MDLSKYKCVVGYGIGQYYDYVKKLMPVDIRLDYLCDSRWEQIGNQYDGLPVIAPNDLTKLKDVFVIVFAGLPRNYTSISVFLDQLGLSYVHANTFVGSEITLTGKALKTMANGIWEDGRGNRLFFDSEIEDSIKITFLGRNNLVTIGERVRAGSLHISCGNNTIYNIGAGSEFGQCYMHGTYGSILIGDNCLFSNGITIRNDDGHHIFDKGTGKRINYPGNITIGNHVWVGAGVTLLVMLLLGIIA